MDLNDQSQYPEHYQLVEAHIEKYFQGAAISVFHEIPTLDIHLDVYHIKPKNADFALLLTSGMSTMPMEVSEIAPDADRYRFAELMALIPRKVDFGKMYPGGTKHDWIISMLKQAAKFPHLHNTWIGVGHSLQAHENREPYSASTDFCGCLVLPTMTFPEDFQKIISPRGLINIYGLFPLYREELEYKITHGFNAFLQFLIKHNAQEVIDVKRENYCQ